MKLIYFDDGVGLEIGNQKVILAWKDAKGNLTDDLEKNIKKIIEHFGQPDRQP